MLYSPSALLWQKHVASVHPVVEEGGGAGIGTGAGGAGAGEGDATGAGEGDEDDGGGTVDPDAVITISAQLANRSVGDGSLQQSVVHAGAKGWPEASSCVILRPHCLAMSIDESKHGMAHVW